MLRSIRSAGIVVLLIVFPAKQAFAGQTIACPEGFTKILEHDGQAGCRRSESVESSDLAEQVQKLWWSDAHCNGAESDRQTGISQNQAGAWTVTMRFWCNSF